MLYPVPSKASKLAGVIPNLADTVEKEHKRLLARKSIIEKRKEDQERQQLEMVVYFSMVICTALLLRCTCL